ncbi:MAG: 50S ribosomal protein L18 [Bacteroidota bacterium]|nr:50S ribosomal protein L18 [Bacteroidota bacterium]
MIRKPIKKRISGRDRRRIRIRKKVFGTPERPRLSVYRSLKHIYAQLVDDTNGKSLGMVSTRSAAIRERLKDVPGKVGAARIIGEEIARLAREKNIHRVVFDRGGYLYHGRVKAVAEGAREGGLEF